MIMRYCSTDELPATVKGVLPPHAQEIYRQAYNHALEEYQDPATHRDDSSSEEIAHKVAWSAVKHKYYKDPQSGKWRAKSQAPREQ